MQFLPRTLYGYILLIFFYFYNYFMQNSYIFSKFPKFSPYPPNSASNILYISKIFSHEWSILVYNIGMQESLTPTEDYHEV